MLIYCALSVLAICWACLTLSGHSVVQVVTLLHGDKLLNTLRKARHNVSTVECGKGSRSIGTSGHLTPWPRVIEDITGFVRAVRERGCVPSRRQCRAPTVKARLATGETLNPLQGHGGTVQQSRKQTRASPGIPRVYRPCLDLSLTLSFRPASAQSCLTCFILRSPTDPPARSRFPATSTISSDSSLLNTEISHERDGPPHT